MDVLLRIVLPLAILLVPAAGASAAVLRDTPLNCEGSGRDYPCSSSLIFAAAPGEANVVSLAAVGDRTEVRDAGAVLVDESELCDPLPDGAVSCRSPYGSAVVATGDGDDTVVLVGARSTVLGGPGSDTITGGDEDDELDGGLGSDVVRGGAGDDRLTASGDGDTLDGGAGRDLVSYRDQRAPIRIDLDAGTGGGDRLTGVEDAVGGAGADVLIGDAGPNGLTANRGDVADGRGGDDDLVAESGPARLAGGPGDDEIDSIVGTVDVDCGTGKDVVRNPGATDVVSRSCERVEGGFGFVVLLSPTAVAVRAPAGQPGVAVLRAGAGEHVVGRRALGPGPPRAIRLNASGRTLARRSGTVPARLRAQRTGRRNGGDSIEFRLRL